MILTEFLEKLSRTDWKHAAAVPILASFLYTVALGLTFVRLPTQVPTHFGIDGTPNGWMSRGIFSIVSLAFTWGMSMVGLAVVFATRRTGPPEMTAAVLIGYWFVASLVVVAFCMTLYCALESTNFSSLLLLACSLLLVILSVAVAFRVQ